jgi:hypothetical protein
MQDNAITSFLAKQNSQQSKTLDSSPKKRAKFPKKSPLLYAAGIAASKFCQAAGGHLDLIPHRNLIWPRIIEQKTTITFKKSICSASKKQFIH